MSTKARHGPFREDDGLNRPLFRSPAPELRRVIWRDFHPVLLRSAGVFGLAGVIVAVIAGAALSDRPAPAMAQQGAEALPREATETVAPVDTEEAAAQRLAALSTSQHEEADAPPELLQAARGLQEGEAPSRDSASVAPAAPPVTPSPPPQAVLPAADPALPSEPGEPSATAAAKDAIRTALAPSPAPGSLGRADQPSPWGEEAVNCPRKWMPLRDSQPASDGSTGCEPNMASAAQAADLDARLATGETGGSAPAIAAVGPEPDGFSNAALNLAPGVPLLEDGTSGFVPPFPRVRPEPPPQATKKPTRTRTAARGKLGPPPNCGKKYARWRYVNKQPTWYCK